MNNNSKKIKDNIKERLLAQIEKLEAKFLTIADADFYFQEGLFYKETGMGKTSFGKDGNTLIPIRSSK